MRPLHPTSPLLHGVIALVIAAALCLPGVALAVQAHLEMDLQQLRVGETASLRLVVTGGAADSSPVLPELDTLIFVPQRPRSELVSVNFQTTRITTYNWAVRATGVGEATIGPLRISVAGRPLRVAPLQIEVLEATRGDEGPNVLVATLDPSPDGLAPGQAVPLWQGQALVYRFSFSHRDPVVGRAQWTQPDFVGFDLVQGIEQDSREYNLQRGEHLYTVHDIDVPLLASQPGEHEIAASVVAAQFPVERQQRRRPRDPFEEMFGSPFGGSLFTETRSEVMASNTLPVVIQALPQQGVPAGFDGLVGSFEASAELADGQVRVGDSVTLTVSVRGDGVLTGLRLPPAPDSQDLRCYDDEPEVRAGMVGGHFRSRAELKRALVPMVEGVLALPPITLSWFDPAQERYVEWVMPAMEIEVLPGEPGTAPAVVDFGQDQPAPHDAVATLGEDILPIHSDAALRDKRFSPTRPLPILLVLLPGLALVLQLGVDLRARGGRRSRRKRQVLALLEGLPQGRAERLAVLEQAFREAAGLALQGPPAAVDPERLEAGLPEPLAQQAAGLYRDLERARYAGLDVADLEITVRALVRQLLGRAR
jgi:hypothetical protein